jgi:hypothetical protein
MEQEDPELRHLRTVTRPGRTPRSSSPCRAAGSQTGLAGAAIPDHGRWQLRNEQNHPAARARHPGHLPEHRPQPGVHASLNAVVLAEGQIGHACRDTLVGKLQAAGVTHPSISSLDRFWQQLPGLLKPAGRLCLLADVQLNAPDRLRRLKYRVTFATQARLAGRVLHVLLCAPPRQAPPGISPRGSPVGGGGHWPMAWLPRGVLNCYGISNSLAGASGRDSTARACSASASGYHQDVRPQR